MIKIKKMIKIQFLVLFTDGAASSNIGGQYQKL